MINEHKESFSNRLPRLFSEFFFALKSAGLLVGVGLTAGFGLTIVANYLARNPEFGLGVVTRVIDHVGTGFIVASIALFFYEWRGQPRKTDQLVARFSDEIDKSSSEALDRSLRSLLGRSDEVPPQYLRDVIVDIKSLVEAVGQLKNESRWIVAVQISILSKLIRDARQNAESLTMLNTRGETRFRVPRAEELVDYILAAQMQTMEAGDSYDVVSSLGDWRGRGLIMLHQKTQEAILRRNVAVRRVFSIFQYDGLSSKEARIVLSHHLTEVKELESKSGGGYQVRLVRDKELGRSTSKFLRDKIKHANFGIFTHGAEKLHVIVNKADLSDLTMSSDRDLIDLYSNSFHELWELALPLTEESIEQVMREITDR